MSRPGEPITMTDTQVIQRLGYALEIIQIYADNPMKPEQQLERISEMCKVALTGVVYPRYNEYDDYSGGVSWLKSLRDR